MARKSKPPDKTKVKKYQEYLTSYKCVKTSLKSIIRNKQDLIKINRMVHTMNRIVTHAYQFLKMYCIKEFYDHNNIPAIDQKLIVLIMKTFCTRDARGRDPSNDTQVVIDKLDKFYEKEYKRFMVEPEQLSYTYLNHSLEYEATSIITCLSNHIQEHFDQMLNRYVNIAFDKQGYQSEYSTEKSYAFRAELDKVKKDLIRNIDALSIHSERYF